MRSRPSTAAAVVLALTLASCSRAEPARIAPPVAEVQTFDAAPRAHIVTATPLQVDPGPDASALFARAVECYPAPSWFRPEITAELRAGARGYSGTGEPVSNGAAVVLRLPLFSALEVDRERERESQRRLAMSTAVGQFVESLVQHRLTDQALMIHRSIEARAQKRVAAGVAETAEQLAALREVAALEIKRVEWLAKITTARLQLVGLCSAENARGLDNYLTRFQPLQPGHRPTGDR